MNDIKDVLSTLSPRMGPILSTRILNKEIECDHSHEYNMVFRQDMLDFGYEDYYSFRRLCGKNTKKQLVVFWYTLKQQIFQ